MNRPLATFYAKRIIKGYIKIEDVPADDREAVLDRLKEIKEELDKTSEATE